MRKKHKIQEKNWHKKKLCIKKLGKKYNVQDEKNIYSGK